MQKKKNNDKTTEEILTLLLPHFRMLGLKSAFYKFQILADLTETEEQAVINQLNPILQPARDNIPEQVIPVPILEDEDNVEV